MKDWAEKMAYRAMWVIVCAILCAAIGGCVYVEYKKAVFFWKQ